VYAALGELVADNIIANLSRSEKLHVVSRFSSSKLRDKDLTLAVKAQYLDADYLLNGSYHVVNDKVILHIELVKASEDRVVWVDRKITPFADLFEINSEMCLQISQSAQDAILDVEVKAALIKPLPNLNSYSLFLSGVHLIHQASPASFERGGEILEHLTQRHPRSAHARTWNATLHMLRTTRGLTADVKKEASQALRHTYEALSIEPSNALALATEGIIHCQLKDDPESGYRRLNDAVTHDPSCALGWLYLSTVQSLRGNFADGVICGERAVSLSPIDPQDYFYYSLWGTALLANGQSIKARDILLKSMAKNRYHAPTVRMLIVAYIECGQGDLARELLKHLLTIQPSLTATKYLSQSKANLNLRQRYLSALVDAGLPL
jgi:TolB-like protein/Flp pilus assembly protein TadD